MSAAEKDCSGEKEPVTEIVNELRNARAWDLDNLDIMVEAANEIDRLRAEIELQRRLAASRQEALQGTIGQLERMTRERDDWRRACLAHGEKARQAELERADAAGRARRAEDELAAVKDLRLKTAPLWKGFWRGRRD